MIQKLSCSFLTLCLLTISPLWAQEFTSIPSALEWNDSLKQPVLNNKMVRVTGVVMSGSALEASLGSKRYVLLGQEAGIRIINTKDDYLAMTGDSVIVQGRVILYAGLPTIIQTAIQVVGKDKSPKPIVAYKCDSSMLYRFVEIPKVYLEDLDRWGQHFGVTLISPVDTFALYGTEYGTAPPPYGWFSVRGVCGRTKGNRSGYRNHLTIVDIHNAITQSPSTVIRFQKTDMRIYSNQKGEVTLVLNQPLTEDGWVKIKLTNTDVKYGSDHDYTTDPEPQDGIITLPVLKDMQQVSFKVSVNTSPLLRMFKEAVRCEVIETSAGLETVKKAGIVVKVY